MHLVIYLLYCLHCYSIYITTQHKECLTLQQFQLSLFSQLETNNVNLSETVKTTLCLYSFWLHFSKTVQR